MTGEITSIGYAPDLVATVIGNQQTAVSHLEYSYRTAIPRHFFRWAIPSNQSKILRSSGGLLILEGDKRDGVTDLFRAIPRSMKREERTAAILVGKWLR